MGAACPFDNTNRSLSGFFGSFGSKRSSAKNTVATISAAEQQLVGCPLPAAVVGRVELVRRTAEPWSIPYGPWFLVPVDLSRAGSSHRQVRQVSNRRTTTTVRGAAVRR